MKPALIGLGSNLDDPLQRVREALAMLREMRDSKLVRCSPLYATAPWGETDQPDFINAVAEVETGLEPVALLEELQSIERRAGRVRNPDLRWGPRRLDLDLLWFAGESVDRPELTVPHPRMHQRAFVLQPLVDLEPDFELPVHGRVDRILASLDCGGIRLIDPAPLATISTRRAAENSPSRRIPGQSRCP